MKILIFYRHFPVAIGRYIHWGLENLGHEVFSVGPYSGTKIPWGPQYDFPAYDFPPDLASPDIKAVPVKDVLKHVKEQGFEPELLIQASDTSYLEGKAPIKNILIGTDPHSIDYNPHIKNVDNFVSMQKYYLREYPQGSLWMPYGYDEHIHKYLPTETLKHDVVFIGLQYEQRTQALQAISDKGWDVFSTLGIIYDEYNKLYNEGMIAFNWSSKKDLPARFWEGLAMKRCVLTNLVPDLIEFDFEEGVDYVGFDTQEEAVSKADFYLERKELLFKIANNGYNKVKPHTWTNRVKQLLKEI